MKYYSNYLIEKPFSCDVEGCSMKFSNGDHLTVHKKRHDMVLNLGLGSKGTTTDQTPTPTQFIRNCEEVGLFQDLQNVNPFEETFRKAVEHVKSGQPLQLDKSFQSNPPDDTLHTPNIFPHISDVLTVDHQDNCLKPENIPSCEDGILKEDIGEDVKVCKTENPTEQSTTIQPRVLSQQSNDGGLSLEITNNIENKSTVEKDAVILNVAEGHFLQLITPDNSQSSNNMVLIKNPTSDIYPPLPLTAKDKLKKSLNEKKTGKCLELKVPILKCPVKKNSVSLSNKFSKFSKNALKLITKLENPDAEDNELCESASQKQKKRKGEKFRTKESRSEFLARSRAASFRCREKKKMYVLYLEKVNGELSTANQNLQLINMSLQKQIRDLHAELIKHKNCSAADKNTETVLTTTINIIGDEKISSECQVQSQQLSEVVSKIPVSIEVDSAIKLDVLESVELSSESDNIIDFSSSMFDVAEVILDSETRENEIPLYDSNKSSDIIVRFNSAGNDIPVQLPPDLPHLGFFVEGLGVKAKQIITEHSYFYRKQFIEVDQHLMSYKSFKESMSTVSTSINLDECKSLDPLQLQLDKNNSFSGLHGLSTKVLLEPKTPPPLILLKPFKKRSLLNKQSEKT